MAGIRLFLIAAFLATVCVIGQGKERKLRDERDKILTREANELSAPAGVDLAAAEADAMSEFVGTRALANVGCQYCTETIVILDNSSAIFDKELWMFKLLLKEIAVAFLRVNNASRFGLILTTQPAMPVIIPVAPNGQNIQAIWQAIKGIQRVDMLGNVATATETALTLFNFGTQFGCTHNLLLLTAPYPALVPQLGQAAQMLCNEERIRRFAVGTRMTQPVYQVALEAFVGCPGCGHVQYVGNCTPAKFLFLLKRLYPLMCVPGSYCREAAIMTFQVDGLPVDDDNAAAFVDKFLDVVSQSTGVEREYLEVIDIRDSGSTAGPQLNARRLKSIETLTDLPQDTLLDVVVRDTPSGLRDSPFRIAGRLDTDLRNELSPVATLFNNEFSAIPKMRKVSQPRESIFTRPNGGLTFHKLYLGGGPSSPTPLSDILQH